MQYTELIYRIFSDFTKSIMSFKNIAKPLASHVDQI